MQNKFINFSLSLWAGLILTPLRLCTGWLIFSAFWRRVVLKPEALNILSPEYEGLKFNHFIPTSSGLTPMIKYLVLHPQFLFVFMWVFTIVEGIVGLCLLLGFFTRLASVISFFLLLGIMLGAGWLGTTCVDEWQIGVFGTAASIVLFLAGGGFFSLDHLLRRTSHAFQGRFLSFWTSGPLFVHNEGRKTYWLTLILSVFAIFLALSTNQINVRGVWGPFKNKAIKPHITLSDLTLAQNGNLKMNIFRDAGPDTYGSFAVLIRILDEQGKVLIAYDASDLGILPLDQIQNRYLVKVQPNGRSLVIPLGALATIELKPSKPQKLSPGNYLVEVTDIDGSTWKAPVQVT